MLNASGCSLCKLGRPRAALVALLCMVGAARADSPSDQAEVLFQRGKKLLAADKIAEACAAFDESQQLEATPATMLNQANCRERNGQLATARALYVEAARQTGSTTDARAKKMHASATSRADQLEPRLSTLRISVPATSVVDGLEVSRDGAIAVPTSWNEVLPIDGGTYRVSARAPGKVAWSETVIVAAERDARVVEVPRLVELAGVPAPRVTKADAPPPITPPSETPRMAVTEEPRWTGRRKLAVGLAAGGVAGLATGSALGVLSNRKRSDAEALCPDPRRACDAAGRANALSTSGSHLAIAADLAFAVAAGAATAAVILWVTGAPESQHGVAIAPAASPGQCVITAIRSW